MARHLQVILYSQVIGTLTQSDGGQHSFRYADPNARTPLSLSMPPRSDPYPHRVVEPFLEGLLPERESVRTALGERFGVSGRNPFALLEHVGLDCAGAVQFCRDESVPDALAGAGTLEPVVPSVAERLRALRANPAGWVIEREHWSLAGAQAKFALRQEGGWWSATGAEPTSHIFKPGVDDLRDHALNEHICLAAARAVGLRAAHSEYQVWDDQPAIVITRYDRAPDASGLGRIHQEDLCQARGVYPRDKYESDGGPRAVDVIATLRRFGPPSAREDNVSRFVDGLLFNYLIGAHDAHAKNYSVLLAGDDVRLAPLYDVASGLAYERRHLPGLGAAAMAIGGGRAFGSVGRRHLEQFASEARLDPDHLIDRMRALASAVPVAISDALDDPSVRDHTKELEARLMPAVSALCARTVTQLGARSTGRDRGTDSA